MLPSSFWIVLFFAITLLVAFVIREFRLRTRRQKVLAHCFPEEWVGILERNVPLYRSMLNDMRQDFQNKVHRFIEHKKFIPCGGLDDVTDEMKVTIAGNACMLVLNRDITYPFKRVYSVLVYPTSFFNSRDEEEELMMGEAWSGGSVVVAWDNARKTARDLRDGKNLVLHEFAHQLDLEHGGEADGRPVLEGYQHRTWARVLGSEFQKLQEATARGKRTALDSYGADDPAEFFAVATEAFFERPDRLLRDYPDLYSELRSYYKVDPVRWRR
ncbi:MAG: zinc-dependent peptidase [Verrucomicrobiales bacterium]|nr:zinc-dependent peptidase [Verrucomicrobiales bacterium]